MTTASDQPGVSIGAVNSSISVTDDDAGTHQSEQVRADFADIERIRDLLRPIIVDLMGEEFARYRRMRG